MNQIVSREMSKKENIIEMIGFCAKFLQSKAPLGDTVIWHQGTQRIDHVKFCALLQFTSYLPIVLSICISCMFTHYDTDFRNIFYHITERRINVSIGGA